MPSSGGTTGTPVTGGSGVAPTSQALKRTILPLATYAQIIGLSPVHFQGAFGQTVWPVKGACGDVWPRYSWQSSDRISHSDLVNAICDAEEDICRVLGYYPAPKWISKEIHVYPRPYRRDLYGFGWNVRGLYKSVIPEKGKFIEAGQRAATLVGTATTGGGSLVYTDEDGDGFFETATITLSTTLTDACEINAYFTGMGGEPEWEIRPARSKTITGGNIVLVYDSWLLIDPDLLSAYPTADDFNGVDISTVANYVSSVDVYREYTDFTQESAEFSWEPKPNNLVFQTFCTACDGGGCPACQNTTQTGCIHVRDVDRGIVVPVPATYDSDDAQWNEVNWTECREPDTVKIWYYAGDLDERFLRDSSCNRLSSYFAHAIAWLATARLRRPFCKCDNVRRIGEDLRRDMAFAGTGEGEGSFILSDEDLSNPFGTKKGEVMAWRRIGKLTQQVRDFAIV